MTFGIVGLGLMGGGFARAIRGAAASGKLDESGWCDAARSGGTAVDACSCTIVACDARADVLEAAKAEGIIDAAFSMQEAAAMLKDCDVTFVCLYPDDAFRFIKEHAADFSPDAIVTDIAGVKGHEVAECESACRQYIAGHPMAGSDREGFGHSDTVHFEGRNYIVIPRSSSLENPASLSGAAGSGVNAGSTVRETGQLSDCDRLERFKAIIRALGFGQIIETTAKTHDSKIAFTSQLCHVIASALVDCAEDERVTEFGGGSFEDLTRIAMINAPLWTELFLSNKDALLPHVDAFMESMQKFRAAIADNDAQSLEKDLAAVRTKRALMRKTEATIS